MSHPQSYFPAPSFPVPPQTMQVSSSYDRDRRQLSLPDESRDRYYSSHPISYDRSGSALGSYEDPSRYYRPDNSQPPTATTLPMNVPTATNNAMMYMVHSAEGRLQQSFQAPQYPSQYYNAAQPDQFVQGHFSPPARSFPSGSWGTTQTPPSSWDEKDAYRSGGSSYTSNAGWGGSNAVPVPPLSPSGNSTSTSSSAISISLANPVTFQEAAFTHEQQSSTPSRPDKSQSERPYACTICGFAFLRNHDLNRHMRGHENLLFPCDGCGKLYARKDSLRRHQNGRCEGPEEEVVVRPPY